MQKPCPQCKGNIPVPDQYVGRIKCHNCGHIFITKGQLAEQREYVLKKLMEYESSGFKYVRWWSSKDQHVCIFCSERHNRLFTMDEVRKFIKDKFCQPKDFWQGCRCCLLAANDPSDEIKKPTKNKGVHVSNRVEQVNGETVITFQIDLSKKLARKLREKFKKNKF